MEGVVVLDFNILSTVQGQLRMSEKGRWRGGGGGFSCA